MTIAICGDPKYRDEMIKAFHALSKLGDIALLPFFDYEDSNKEEMLQESRSKRIRMSDGICIVGPTFDCDGDTQKDIDLAEEFDKEIIWFDDGMILTNEED